MPDAPIHLQRTHSDKVEVQRKGLKPYVTLGVAIMDLPPLSAGAGKDESAYDMEKRDRHAKEYGVE